MRSQLDPRAARLTGPQYGNTEKYGKTRKQYGTDENYEEEAKIYSESERR